MQVGFAVARPRADGQWTSGRKTVPATLNNPWSRPGYLGDADDEILDLLRVDAAPGASSVALSGVIGHLALARMVDSGRCFLGADREEPVRRGPVRALQVNWREHNGAFRCALELDGGGQLLDVDPPAYLDIEQRLFGTAQCTEALNSEQLATLRQAPPVPAERAAAVARRLALSTPGLPTPVPVEQIRDPRAAGAGPAHRFRSTRAADGRGAAFLRLRGTPPRAG